MATEPGERRRYPTWVRVALVGLQAAAVVVGLLLGNATYEAWSKPDNSASTTTTTVVQEQPVPITEDTLG
jgi:hypothetical protein